jgi:magnesium-transporting ATPase (P-type)
MVRNSLLIKYSFYKNVAFFVVQFWFAIFCRFSGQTLYDDWMITFFNILFTSLPPFFIGLFEKDVSEAQIVAHPEINRGMAEGYMFRISDLFVWLGLGVLHSLLFFFVAYGVFVPNAGAVGLHGDTAGLWSVSAYVNTYALLTVLLVVVVHTKFWVVWSVAGILFGLAIWLLVWLIESFAPNTGYLFWTIPAVVVHPTFWLTLVAVLVAAILPSLCYIFTTRQFRPPPWQILAEETRAGTGTTSIPLMELNSQTPSTS